MSEKKREILFRGKRCDTHDWVYGAFCQKDCDSPFGEMVDRPSIIKYDPPCDGFWFRVDPETVGQLTGLTDKNGKRIFEGDIVKFTDSPFGYSYTGSVCFYKGSFCIQYTYLDEDRFHRIGKTEEWRDMGASGTITFKYEVIGNIHDNPELLKETSNV